MHWCRYRVRFQKENEQDMNAMEVGVQIGRSIGTIPADLLLVGCAPGLLDGITKQLDPSMDTMEIVAHYAWRATRETYNSVMFLRQIHECNREITD